MTRGVGNDRLSERNSIIFVGRSRKFQDFVKFAAFINFINLFQKISRFHAYSPNIIDG